MRTRTLLLLAVSCGLAILLAGGIQLLRLANQKSDPPLGKGDTGRAGDAMVTLDGVVADDDTLIVTVTLAGVDDPDGLDGLFLVAPNKRIAPLADRGDADACTGFTVQPVQCTLAFDTSELTGSDRQLLLLRAEERALWKLV